MGMGFPPFRGGLIKWADTVGATVIAARLKQLAAKFGPLYEPCDYLVQCAAKGVPLAQGPNGARAKL